VFSTTGIVGADTAWLAVVYAEKEATYDPAGTTSEKSWQKTVAVCPAVSVSPPPRTYVVVPNFRVV